MSSKISLWTGIIAVGAAIAIWLNVTIAPDNYVKSAAQKYFDKGDYRGALADYNQAIALDPFDGYAYTLRGYLKEKKLNDIQGALADYDQAISLGYKSAHAYRDVLTFLIENNLK